MSIDQVQERKLHWNQTEQRFDESEQPFRTPKCGGKFLKGPIPWSWITAASKLPGNALDVGLCVWRLLGATGRMQVPLSNSEVAVLGIDRHAKSRALAELEKAGLILIERRGKKPVLITVVTH